jgi:hypothetical protein
MGKDGWSKVVSNMEAKCDRKTNEALVREFGGTKLRTTDFKTWPL